MRGVSEVKLLICSDVHFDINTASTGVDVVHIFVQFVKKKKVDRVVIAGDISDSAETTIQMIDFIEKESDVPVSFIPGNHDIWGEKENESEKAYEKLKSHPSCLINNPILLNEEVVLVGIMGWYDYSFGTNGTPLEVFKRKKKTYMQDGLYAKWNLSDGTLFKQEWSEGKKVLDELVQKEVMLITHFVPYDAYITYSKMNSEWNFCNAYFGGREAGEIIDSYDNISALIFGHIHKRHGRKHFHGKDVICTPLGYHGLREWQGESVYEEFERTCCVIDV